jgi:uncharacterized protein
MFELPAPVESGGTLLDNLILFGRMCKLLGMTITPGTMHEAARALTYIDLGNRADFYYALRAVMVAHERDLALFDKAFRAFWKRPLEKLPALNPPPPQEWKRNRKMQFLPPLDAQFDPIVQPDEHSRFVAVIPTQSSVEMLRYKNFADMSPDEIAAARLLMKRLPWSLGYRETRRYQIGSGEKVDIRRAMRRSMRFAGEIMDLPPRTHRIKPRPIVVLCDISGSMERYTRLLLHFMHTLAANMAQVESFVFSTRLERITRALRRKSVDAALRDVGTSVNVWGSGTRTDEALHAFNYRWSRRILGHGTVVLLITDGWERGDTQQLESEIARLRRNCYRLIWLNPLLGDARYAPLTRGAKAMLPHVDDFLPVHNLASLEALAKEIGRVDWRRNPRMENTWSKNYRD